MEGVSLMKKKENPFLLKYVNVPIFHSFKLEIQSSRFCKKFLLKLVHKAASDFPSL